MVAAVFREHCLTTHLIWGLKIRTAMRVSEGAYHILKAVTHALELVMLFLLGRKRKRNAEAWNATAEIPFSEYQIVPENELTIPSTGYKTTINTAVFFCTLVLIGAFVIYSLRTRVPELKIFFTHPMIVTAISILMLFGLDRVLPRIVAWMINKALNARTMIFDWRARLMVR